MALAALVLAGCSSSSGRHHTRPSGQPVPADANATLTVNVDGTMWDATSTRSVCASAAGTGDKHAFDVDYLDTAVDGLTALELVVQGPGAARADISEFHLRVTIRHGAGNTTLAVNQDDGGPGTASVDYSGGGGAATVTFSGKTPDGHHVSGTVACSTVASSG